jgi:MFS family permease
MIFLVAYGIFEVPSNYFLKKFTPSKWISLLMFSWGALTIGLGGSGNFATVTVLRFFLGAFEAGILTLRMTYRLIFADKHCTQAFSLD